jgi:hypothetical protein
MTTCRDLIDRAGRQLGVLAAGESATGDDAHDLMRHLQDLVMDLPLLMDGPWTDVRLTSGGAYAARDGERINKTDFPDTTVILSATRLDDCGRIVAQRDGARAQVIGGADAGVYVFVAEKAAWSRLDALSIVDESPFGRKDDAGLAALICASAAEEYAAPLGPIGAQRAQRAIAQFRARFYRPVLAPAEPALLALSDLGLPGVAD